MDDSNGRHDARLYANIVNFQISGSGVHTFDPPPAGQVFVITNANAFYHGGSSGSAYCILSLNGYTNWFLAIQTDGSASNNFTYEGNGLVVNAGIPIEAGYIGTWDVIVSGFFIPQLEHGAP